MAQKLKEETRQAIINAAKEEFLEKGYDDASMRSIAAKANITVGNIYRYFENKEELNRYIITETSEDLKKLLDSLKIDRLSMEPRVFDMKTDPSQLLNMIDKLSYRLVDLYLHKEEEFNILLNDVQLNNTIRNWFEATIRNLIFQSYTVADRRRERDVLAHAYAAAVFEGLRQIFFKAEKNEKELLRIVRTYLNSFMKMVNDEYPIRKYL